MCVCVCVCVYVCVCMCVCSGCHCAGKEWLELTGRGGCRLQTTDGLAATLVHDMGGCPALLALIPALCVPLPHLAAQLSAVVATG